MDKLNRYVVKLFVIFAVAVVLLKSVTDSLFDDIILPKLEGNVVLLFSMAAISLIVSFLIVIIASLLFAKISNRRFEALAKRLRNEQNMLFAKIAHDIKTPITSILGFSQALRDGKADSGNLNEICETIYRKAKHTNELIDTMFSYTKLTSEGYSLNLQKADLCRIVKEVVAGNYEMFEEKHIELDTDIPDTPIVLMLDKTEFFRALSNLIANACKHNPVGSKVCVSAKTKNGRVIVSVADNGALISDEIKSSLFQPFVTGNQARGTNNGSGLGLAISKEIVELHGGEISYSRQGDWNMFRIWLPMR